jgi:DMSO/TMAO reductase YedYZ molybdopterin-dependent catalytic subunit
MERFETVSLPSRIAEPSEGITPDELALAARNHGMPLEALAYDLTPPGLHYVLVHFDIPLADEQSWQLTVDGEVNQPLDLDMTMLRAMPRSTVRVTMECAGNGRALLEPRPISQPWLVEAVGTAEWSGTALRHVLAEAGVNPSAVDVVFTGADHGVERGVEQDYQRALPIERATAEDAEVLLAYEMNGLPLPPQHGYPLRLVVPGWYGMAHVKWLRAISVIPGRFDGFQNSVAYRLRQQPDDLGEPVEKIAPRALLIPPGFPDFMSRTRVVAPGPVLLQGRAWSGRAPITGVELIVDDGQIRLPADLEPPHEHPWAWRRWETTWTATPGRHILSARATDADGNRQPVEQGWNRGGFANNMVQRVPVACFDPDR